MEKSSLGALCIVLLACSAVLVFGTGSFVAAQAQTGTTISGVITANTTWTKENSPYVLSGNTLVPRGVTLTITPNVTVNLGTYYLEINGTLRAIGDSVSPIVFVGGYEGIRFDRTSTAWNETAQTGNIISNAFLNGTAILASGVSSPKIVNNIFLNCRGDYFGIAVGTAIAIESFHITGLEVTTATIISNNTIIGSDKAISIHDIGLSSPIIQFNNFINNQNNVYLYAPTNDVNATYNWWGTTNSTAISQKIWDFNRNDFSVGTVSYVPFLGSPNNNTPISVFASASSGGSIVPSGYVIPNYGGNQSFSIVSDSNYYVANVFINGTSVGNVTSYTIQNITGATTISATFSAVIPETPTFAVLTVVLTIGFAITVAAGKRKNQKSLF